MAKYKLILIMVLIIALSSFVFSITESLSSFIGQTNPFLALPNTTNYSIQYLSFPINSYIKNITLVVNSRNVSPGLTICEQQFANVNTSCGGKNTGTYITDFTSSASLAYDGNYGTAGSAGGGEQKFLWINYTLPDDFDSDKDFIVFRSKQALIDSNFTILKDCINTVENRLSMRVTSDQITDWAGLNCYNQTGDNWYEIRRGTGGEGGSIYDQTIWYHLRGLFETLEIKSNGITLYNNTDILEFKEISLNNSHFNNLLDNQCLCDNCSIVGNNCQVPLEFINNNTETIFINLTNATYSYSIDNCSNSFDIPSNATAYTINFYDSITNNKITADFNGQLSYLDTDYTFNQVNQQNTSFCIYPNWADLTVNGYIYYGGEGYTTKYNVIDGVQFNNNTKSIDLFLINTTDDNTGNLIVQVADDFDNFIVGANIKLLEYNSDTDSFIQITQCYSDTNGECIFDVELNIKFYIVTGTFEKNGQVFSAQSTQTGQLIKIDNTIIPLRLKTTETFELPNTFNLIITPSNTELVGNTSFLTATFNDPDNNNHTVCISYSTENGLNEIQLTQDCVSGSAGVVNFAGGYLLNREFTYLAKIYILYTDGTTTNYATYKYEAEEGTFKSEYPEFLIPILFVMLLSLLAFSLYLKNMGIFAIGTMILSPLTIYFDPTLLGGTTMTFIIVLCLCILYCSGKKESF